MSTRQRLTAALTAAKKSRVRTRIGSEDGLSAFELSKFVNAIEVGLYHSGRVSLHIKIAVLRALADRYPNIWPSVREISKKSHCGVTQVKIALRELEFEDELISEVIAPGQRSKVGGKKNTVQYQLNVEAITRLLELQPLVKLVIVDGQPRNPTGKATGETCKPTGSVGYPTATDPNPPAPDGIPAGYRRGIDKEETTSKPTNLPAKRAAGVLARIFGQAKGIPLPGGDGMKNRSLVADAMTLAPGRVVHLWKHWLATRDLNGMKYPLGIFVTELPGLIGAESSSEREYTAEEMAALKEKFDRQNELDREAIMNWTPQPERVVSAEDLFGT